MRYNSVLRSFGSMAMRALCTARFWIRSAVLSAVLFTAAACATPEPVPVFAEIGFQHLEPYRFDVASIDIRSTHRPTFRAPHVEHEMPVSPEMVAKRWARDRLQASGQGEDIARFTIHDATVTEKTLSVEKGVLGAFQTDQAERYDGSLEVSLEIVDPNGIILGHTSAKVWRHSTVAEDASINEREQVWYSLVEALGKDLDGQLSNGINTWLGRYRAASIGPARPLSTTLADINPARTVE